MFCFYCLFYASVPINRQLHFNNMIIREIKHLFSEEYKCFWVQGYLINENLLIVSEFGRKS